MTKTWFAFVLAAVAAGAAGTVHAQVTDIPPVEVPEPGEEVPDQGTQGKHFVNKLRYTNNGGYEAAVTLGFKEPGSTKRRKLGCGKLKADGTPCSVNLGETVVVRLDESQIAEGAEVWLVVKIISGDTESCRKENAKFYFNKRSDTTGLFTTAGTTLNKNRCKFGGES